MRMALSAVFGIVAACVAAAQPALLAPPVVSTPAPPPIATGPAPSMIPLPGTTVVPPPPRPALPIPHPAPPPEFNVGVPPALGGGQPVSQPVPVVPQFDTRPRPLLEERGGRGADRMRVYGSFEYLLWFAKGGETPPLAATVTGGSTSTIGPDQINGGMQSGFRATFGAFLDWSQRIGGELSYMWIADNSERDYFRSSAGTLLGRPFIDSNSGRNTVFILSSLDGTTTQGAMEIRRHFSAEGGEVNLLWRGRNITSENWHWILGYRYFNLEESLRIESATISTTPAISAGAFDRFATRNRFHGAQFGARWSYIGDRLTADVTGKIALGGIGQEVDINGASVSVPAGTAGTLVSGGLLAQPSNMGNFDRTRLAFMPEITANLGYRITRHVTGFVGYNFMWVSNVVRPAGQIDPILNPTRLPFSGGTPSGPVRPVFDFDGESFWLQGINFGLVFRY